MRPLDTDFILRISTEEKTMLAHVAKLHACSRSAVLRTLLEKEIVRLGLKDTPHDNARDAGEVCDRATVQTLGACT